MVRNDKKKVEVIKFIMSGKTVREVADKFGYSLNESVYRILRAFKPLVEDYAKNHTLENTLNNFKGYGLTEEWIINNGIQCYNSNDGEILRKYRFGTSLEELTKMFGKTDEELRTLLKDNRIPIREDEAKIIRGEGFITIEENATDINYRKLVTGNIVFIRQAKYTTDKNIIPSEINRPALVISPQWYLDSNNQTFTVIYGTTVPQKYEQDCLKINQYYTGKETYFPFNRIDTVRYTDLSIRKGEYEILSEIDQKIFRVKFGNYFGFTSDEKCEIQDEEKSDMILKLFNLDLSRAEIQTFLQDTVYSCSKSLIQSTLDLNGYSGVKQISDTYDEIEEDEEVGYYMHSDEEYEALEKELISVRTERDVYKNLLERNLNLN